MQVAYFEHCGVAHVTRRLWRSDYLQTGKVEIYTIEPWNPNSGAQEPHWYGSTTREDFLRYADDTSPSKTDVAAMLALNGCDPDYDNLHVGQAKRSNLLELA